MRNSDLISGGLMVIFGLVMIFVIVPIQIKSSSEYAVEPKLFPEILLWLFVAMSALLVATRIAAPPDPAHGKPLLDMRNWFFIGAAAGFLLLGYIAIGKIGFVPAGIIMVALIMSALAVGSRNWIELVGVSVIAPVLIYYTLYQIFSVQLPSGALFR